MTKRNFLHRFLDFILLNGNEETDKIVYNQLASWMNLVRVVNPEAGEFKDESGSTENSKILSLFPGMEMVAPGEEQEIDQIFYRVRQVIGDNVDVAKAIEQLAKAVEPFLERKKRKSAAG